MNQTDASSIALPLWPCFMDQSFLWGCHVSLNDARRPRSLGKACPLLAFGPCLSVPESVLPFAGFRMSADRVGGRCSPPLQVEADHRKDGG